ncbi:unnamed protein product [Brassica rapa]|uniref:Uncharacterized protein n=1 Tax=Brassica campestris TaxID=3711 RepID=A0A3P6C261_BRACM|nr:unnamed protein product [Brassica rapa]VDD01969.1 unnamed protein product [Brassica rapa]
MEEVEDGDASTPFWLQSRRNNTYFRRTSSLGGRATTVATQAFFAGAAAILIVYFIIPPFFTSVSQFLRPHLVRKSWDYLNFVVVLFAVICGFLSRNTTGDDESNHSKEEVSENNDVIIDRGSVATGRYWNGDQFRDQRVYKRYSSLRSSSSYPDLRLREFETDERWRFYDDTRVSQCRYEALDPINRNQEEGVDGVRKVVATAEAEVVEELTSPSNPRPLPFAPPSPPRAPPPSKPAKRKTKRVYQNVAPITPVPAPATVNQKISKQEKGGASKDFIIALRRKKKKQRQQSIDGLDLLFGSDHPFDYSPPHPPPPPPPPNRNYESRSSMAKRHNSPSEATQFIGTGSESPLMPIPPPPPPPPFKMPAWKFVKRGDYVRMVSNISISSDEPDDDDDHDVAQSSSVGSMFCPSPDVDTKADDFIARFRAGLKLEKMNSVKRGRSNLGPEPES